MIEYKLFITKFYMFSNISEILKQKRLFSCDKKKVSTWVPEKRGEEAAAKLQSLTRVALSHAPFTLRKTHSRQSQAP